MERKMVSLLWVTYPEKDAKIFSKKMVSLLRVTYPEKVMVSL
jgi:hypothetical protein